MEVYYLTYKMIPGINPKKMNKMMQQMGIKQEEINATEVIIKTNSKNLVIKNPSVTKVNMMGQNSLQITGDIVEESDITQEDIDTVASQANVSTGKAKEALENSEGDLAEAILHLKNNN